METLIAISILLVSVVGPISLIGDSLHKIYYAKDEMVAINLAQEGIEIVRQVRDSNMLAGAAWDTGFTGPNYVADILNNPPLVSNVSDQKIYIDSVTGLYRQGAVYTPTQFSRLITIQGAGDERQIISTVTWKTGGDTGTISVSENLFKWAVQ